MWGVWGVTDIEVRGVLVIGRQTDSRGSLLSQQHVSMDSPEWPATGVQSHFVGGGRDLLHLREGVLPLGEKRIG